VQSKRFDFKKDCCDGSACEQGSTFAQELIWENEFPADSGVFIPVDLTGYTAKMQVRKKAGDPVILELSTANSGITIVGLSGSISLRAEAPVTKLLTPGDFKYDLKLIAPTGFVNRFVFGDFQIRDNSVSEVSIIRTKIKERVVVRDIPGPGRMGEQGPPGNIGLVYNEIVLPGETKVVQSVSLISFFSISFEIQIRNSDLSRSEKLILEVSKSSFGVFDCVSGVISSGTRFQKEITANINGPNLELVVKNNELFSLSLIFKNSRLV
jgi:hypothetical protein